MPERTIILAAVAAIILVAPVSAASPAPRLHSSELLSLLSAMRAGDEAAVSAATVKIGDAREAQEMPGKPIQLITAAQLIKDTKGCDLASLKYFEQRPQPGVNLESYEVNLNCSYYDEDSALGPFEAVKLEMTWNFGKFIVVTFGRAAAPPPIRVK